MERESTKHGRRLDEELVHETASVLQGAPVPAQSREERRQEDPDEGLDEAGGARPDVPSRGLVDEEEATERAELARSVAAARFPAHASELLAAAQRAGADERVLERLDSLAPEPSYPNLQAVWEALGGHREQRGAAERRD